MHPDTLLPAAIHTTSWGCIDPSTKPVLRVRQDELVEIHTLSGGARNLPGEGSRMTVLPAHREILETCKPLLGPHILTGPVAIEGAKPGDRLIIQIEAVDYAQDWGWNAIEPGFGIFPDLAEVYESLAIPIDVGRGEARLPWGPLAKLTPFFGILAVAPDPVGGAVGSVVPGPFGGNMDNRFARAGARVELPVFCEDALFYVGDGHALQGDGEVCDTALETALIGRFRFRVEKASAPDMPEIHTDDLMITMDFDEDLNRAAGAATGRMMDLIQKRAGLSRSEAWRHCSLFADLRVTQMVNRKQGMHCVLPVASLAGC